MSDIFAVNLHNLMIQKIIFHHMYGAAITTTPKQTTIQKILKATYKMEI